MSRASRAAERETVSAALVEAGLKPLEVESTYVKRASTVGATFASRGLPVRRLEDVRAVLWSRGVRVLGVSYAGRRPRLLAQVVR